MKARSEILCPAKQHLFKTIRPSVNTVVEHVNEFWGYNNNNNNNNNLLQLGCNPVAVVILHVNKHEIGYY